jgi:hypothetical protein
LAETQQKEVRTVPWYCLSLTHFLLLLVLSNLLHFVLKQKRPLPRMTIKLLLPSKPRMFSFWPLHSSSFSLTIHFLYPVIVLSWWISNLIKKKTSHFWMRKWKKCEG